MNHWIMILSYGVCFVPLVVIFTVMPYIARKTICFGISVPSGQHGNEELAVLRRGYAKMSALVGALISAAYIALLFILPETAATALLGIFILLYIVAVSALYLRKWRQVKALKQRLGWESASRSDVAADTRFPAAKRAVSPAWFTLYILIIAATVLIGVLLYDTIPAKVVMQADMSGNITRMAEKGPGLILFAPAMQAVMSLVFALVYWAMLKTPPVIDPDNPEVSSRQNAVFKHRWSAWTVAFGAVMLLTFLSVQLTIVQLIDTFAAGWVSVAAAGAAAVSVLAISLATGQSGSRVRFGKKADGTVIRRDDDRYWKWGSLYVNREDPALFVEKRFGIGFTVNFGRPLAVLLFVGLIALIVTFSILVPMLSN